MLPTFAAKLGVIAKGLAGVSGSWASIWLLGYIGKEVIYCKTKISRDYIDRMVRDEGNQGA